MTPTDNSVTCVRCQGQAPYFGHVPVVTRGSSGAAKVLFGQWAEVREANWQLDVYRCTQCGHVELFDLSTFKQSG
jgi:hypothetical protein